MGQPGGPVSEVLTLLSETLGVREQGVLLSSSPGTEEASIGERMNGQVSESLATADKERTQ